MTDLSTKLIAGELHENCQVIVDTDGHKLTYKIINLNRMASDEYGGSQKKAKMLRLGEKEVDLETDESDAMDVNEEDEDEF